MARNFKSAFTLIEILVTLAVVAVLSTVVIVTLNPAELIKQARDSTRISDLNTVNTALSTYAADVTAAYVGTSSVVYVSLPDTTSTCANLNLPALPGGWTYNCATSLNYKNTDGTGWIPVNLNRISFGTPLSQLPIDPKNSTSTGLYYTFVTTGSWWELTAILESDKYGPRMVVDGGASPNAFEQGTNLTLTPSAALDRALPAGPVAPTIASISPTSTTAGDSGFTLTVVGANFTSSSIVNWGASTKTTTYVSSTQLTASILAGDISATGTIAITVSDPVGGVSGGSNFAISARTVFVAGSWTTDSSGGPSQGFGSALAEVGGIFYVLPASNSTTFRKYNPSNQSWTNLAVIPLAADRGASIVKYNSDTLYALRGNYGNQFYKYTISADRWDAMAGTPAGLYQGASISYPGSGDYLYAIRGEGYTDFWRYSVSNNSWGESGVNQYWGAAIAEVIGNFYVLPANDTTTFQKYNPSTQAWSTLAVIPLAASRGASIVRYNSDTLYALRGNYGNQFYKYTISNNTWSPMATTTVGIYQGASLAYPGSGDYIYAIRGDGYTNFWRYSITNNSWGAITSTPVTMNYGAALTALNSDTLYAIRGEFQATFLEYKISSSTWTTKTATPATTGGGGSLTSDGTNVYATRGLGTATFWKYSPGGNSWTVLNNALEAFGEGSGGPRGGIAYSSSLDKIYAISGNSNGVSRSIFSYNISTGFWNGTPSTPVGMNYGAALTALNSDTLYAIPGGSQSNFLEYKISSSTWTSKATTPATTSGGGSLTSDGTNIYATRGGGTATFWKYSPNGNSWSTLTNAPSAFGENLGGPRGGISYSFILNAIFGIPGNNTSIYKNTSQ